MNKLYFIKTTPDAIIPKRANPTDAGMDLYSAEDVVVPPNGGRCLVSTGLKIGLYPNKKIESLILDKFPFARKFVNEGANVKDFLKKLVTDLSLSEEDNFVWQAEVRPRSGLAWKNGVTVLNSPGTIDASYRGDLKVIVVNHDNVPFEIKKGNRIAQLIITKSYLLDVEEVEQFSDKTSRGEGGFGSSGS